MRYYLYLTILLLAIFLLIIVFLIVQFFLIRKLYNSIKVFNDAIKRLTEESQETTSASGIINENVMVSQSPVSLPSTSPLQEQSPSTLTLSNGISTHQEKVTAKIEKQQYSKKQEVLKSIEKRREVKEEHLPPFKH